MMMNRPVQRSACLTALLLLLAAGPAQTRAEVLYGADGSQGTGVPNPNPTLFTIDPETGTSLLAVGSIGFSIGGMAVDPFTGDIYATTGPRGDNFGSLIRIDPNTGAGTLIGGLGPTFALEGTLSGIAFDPTTGNLFGVSSLLASSGGVNLYQVNLATGLAALVGESGVFLRGGGIAIDAAGTIFIAGEDNSFLYTADPTTGLFTQGPQLTGSQLGTGALRSMTFDPDGTLFAVDFAGLTVGGMGSSLLVTVDPVTGVISTRGSLQANTSAIAFVTQVTPPPTIIPEPSSLALAGLGIAGVLAGWRRRRQTSGC